VKDLDSTFSMEHAHTVSVIIPVYNDVERLQRCLNALSNQTYPVAKREIVVVDNGSDVAPDEVVAYCEGARLVHEAKEGSYAARNRGIKCSTGEILAFTDADCVPSPAWLEHGVKCLHDVENVGLVAGRVELVPQTPGHPTPYEYYEMLMYLDQQRAVEQGHYGATANLFAPRSVMCAVGLFNEELVSGGDNEWGQRVHRHGYEQVYCKKAHVRHPARNSFWSLLSKELRVAGGLAQINKNKEAEGAGSDEWSWKDRLQLMVQPLRSALGVVVGSTSRHIPSLIDRLHLGGIILIMRVARRLERWRVRWGGKPLNT
jgi:glycosyltransferase involved in cell wall biosynthesis